MKYLDTVRRGGRGLRQAKVRTLLTAAALAVGGFTLTATLAAANGIKAYSNQLITTNFDQSSLIVTKDKDLLSGGGSPASSKPQQYDDSLTSLGARGQLVKELTQADLAKIAKIPGVSSVFEYYDVNAQYITRPGADKYTAGIEAYDSSISHQFLAGNVSGEVPSGSLVIPDDYLSLLKFSSAQAAIGQPVTVQLQQVTGVSEAQTYKIAAVESVPTTLISGNDDDTLYFSTADAKSLYAYVNQGTLNADHFLLASAKITDGTNKAKLKAAEQAIEHAGYAAESAADAQALISQIINVLQVIILVFGAITLVASFFGVVNTQYISVLERTREIGLMKALGMSRRSVSRLFIIEATWIGFLGAVLGAGVAYAAGTAINPWLSRKISFGSQHLLQFKPLQIVILILFLMLITTIAGLLPARKAAKLDPIEALRTE